MYHGKCLFLPLERLSNFPFALRPPESLNLNIEHSYFKCVLSKCFLSDLVFCSNSSFPSSWFLKCFVFCHSLCKLIQIPWVNKESKINNILKTHMTKYSLRHKKKSMLLYPIILKFWDHHRGPLLAGCSIELSGQFKTTAEDLTKNNCPKCK